VVHLLRLWHATLGKRQVRSPRSFLADSGLLHAFFGVADHGALLGHPRVGVPYGLGLVTPSISA
jgi:hypothetical protein